MLTVDDIQVDWAVALSPFPAQTGCPATTTGEPLAIEPDRDLPARRAHWAPGVLPQAPESVAGPAWEVAL